jgi:hypothetical protein
MAADEAPAFPQLKTSRIRALAGVVQRLLVGVGLDPVSAHDLAGSIEPVQAISRQAVGPPIPLDYHDGTFGRFTWITRDAAFLLKWLSFSRNRPSL